MRILLICGSLREGSVNEAALRTAMRIAPAGVATELSRGLDAMPTGSLTASHTPRECTPSLPPRPIRRPPTRQDQAWKPLKRRDPA
ncbi:NAD(P)H-dependent oxidoreductase [Streptosporangium sp. CA-135522]|uniref:NAD(P)H-dependent oxidoreductase n=1 Tax=Streptosporangium sp. CA-135522 TaxID=3240072 RepID=UPI003D922520